MNADKWGLERSRLSPRINAPEVVSNAALAIEIKRRLNHMPGIIPSSLFSLWIELSAKEEKCRKLQQKQAHS